VSFLGSLVLLRSVYIVKLKTDLLFKNFFIYDFLIIFMKICSGRKTSYLNGNSYEDCKKMAETINDKLKTTIIKKGEFTWSELLIEVDHDELIYKLVLKYLRRDGFDIGNSQNPLIKPKIS